MNSKLEHFYDCEDALKDAVMIKESTARVCKIVQDRRTSAAIEVWRELCRSRKEPCQKNVQISVYGREGQVLKFDGYGEVRGVKPVDLSSDKEQAERGREDHL